VKIRSPKNFWAGVMFLAFGATFAVWALARYKIGSSVRMGPGYFPAVLGGLLALLGAAIVAGSLAIDGPRLPRFNLRPLLLVLASCVAYGYLMQPLGLVLATVALVVISALGGHEFKWKEVAMLSVVLVVFSVLVFVMGLALPFPLWPEAFG
jgi:putative tricarboxylic transport membrane protein